MSGGSSHRNGRSVQFIAHWSLVIGVGLMCLLSVAPVVQAASLVVNTLSDADNGSDGVCSLREAIMAANANANHNECTGTGFGDDVIVFSVTGTIHLQSTLPTIAAASSAGKLTIAGPGAASLTLSGDSDNDGNGDVRVVVVNSGGNLILQGLTIAKGLATCSSFCAVNGGGLLNANGTVTISNSTFSGNSAPTGGSLFIGSNSGTTVQIKNSIVANSSSGGDCHNEKTFIAAGKNFDTDGSCAALDSHFTQVTPAQLNLGPLADNGGPTQTHALLAGSVASDAASDCTLFDGLTPVTQDQRGVSRPQPFAGDCDVGAYEVRILLLQVALAGSGTVTSAPVGIDCGSTCSAIFSETTTSSVTLTASAATGFAFNHWNGCDSPSGNQCTMIVDGNKLVTANFVAADTTPPILANKSATPSAFNPSLGNTTIRFDIFENGSFPVAWEVKIFPKAAPCGSLGSAVKTFTGNTNISGTVAVVWDGKDGSSNPVPEGTYCAKVTATDSAHNSSSIDPNILIDTTAPTVAVTGVVNGTSYSLGAVPVAGCSTTDALSGVAIAATINVSNPPADGLGSHIATCSGGIDNAGNTAPAVHASYTVVATTTCINLNVQAGSSSTKFKPGTRHADSHSIRLTIRNNSGGPVALQDIALDPAKLPHPPYSLLELLMVKGRRLVTAELPLVISSRGKLTLTVRVQKAAGTGKETVNAPYFQVMLSCGVLAAHEPISVWPSDLLQPSESQTVRVQLFDLRGHKLLDRTEEGEWRPADGESKQLANGVYLYRVSVRDKAGKLIKSEVRKLVIHR